MWFLKNFDTTSGEYHKPRDVWLTIERSARAECNVDHMYCERRGEKKEEEREAPDLRLSGNAGILQTKQTPAPTGTV